jgi:hypothetical protein
MLYVVTYGEPLLVFLPPSFLSEYIVKSRLHNRQMAVLRGAAVR